MTIFVVWDQSSFYEPFPDSFWLSKGLAEAYAKKLSIHRIDSDGFEWDTFYVIEEETEDD